MKTTSEHKQSREPKILPTFFPKLHLKLKGINSYLTAFIAGNGPQPPATADVIAAQSQDYVDENLAAFQAQISQLQGKYISRSSCHLKSEVKSANSLRVV